MCGGHVQRRRRECCCLDQARVRRDEFAAIVTAGPVAVRCENKSHHHRTKPTTWITLAHLRHVILDSRKHLFWLEQADPRCRPGLTPDIIVPLHQPGIPDLSMLDYRKPSGWLGRSPDYVPSVTIQSNVLSPHDLNMCLTFSSPNAAGPAGNHYRFACAQGTELSFDSLLRWAVHRVDLLGQLWLVPASTAVSPSYHRRGARYRRRPRSLSFALGWTSLGVSG